jgi:LmbE family N-acetylglucosaminyl deacetylase
MVSFLPMVMSTTPYPRLEEITDRQPENVLVLAPHPDDEIIGCGGTIIKHVAKGSRILVVYLTDGVYPKNVQDVGQDSIWEELSQNIKSEARGGLQQMGCTESIFLDFPNRLLSMSTRACAEALKKIMSDFNPTSVFVPFLLDINPDHSATASILASALKNASIEPWCYSYEVWTTLVPNTIIDITDTMPQKMRALAEYKSQLTLFDYSKRIRGLNSYRSMYVDEPIEYCEAFIKQSASEYVRLTSRLKWNMFYRNPASGPVDPR